VDTLRLLVTGLGGLAGLLAVGWTIEARRRVEERQDAAAREETIRDLAAQLKAAGRHLRRLRALEALVTLMGW
jgi:hypothetical protein